MNRPGEQQFGERRFTASELERIERDIQRSARRAWGIAQRLGYSPEQFREYILGPDSLTARRLTAAVEAAIRG